jgi:hypothetical protein
VPQALAPRRGRAAAGASPAVIVDGGQSSGGRG